MAVLGTHAVTLLKDNDRAGLKAGDTVDAECWLGLDAYQPCAEVKVNGQTIGLGRMDYGAPWKFADETMQEQYQRFLIEE